MEGEPQGPLRGIIPRTMGDIFNYIAADPDPTAKYLVRDSYLQVGAAGRWAAFSWTWTSRTQACRSPPWCSTAARLTAR